MKKILRIAQLELSTLFYSPIAWVIVIIFTFQASHIFVEAFAVYQKGVFLGRMDYKNFTNMIFNDSSLGLFPVVQNSLYLYIPLLTMGLISKELSSGSIKLLLSSPVKTSEIVLGKFVSMMIFGLLLVLLLVVFLVIGMYAIPSMDVGMVLTGILGFYLLLCAYAAIGLFFSSLSSYQVIVAIGTLVILALLNYIGLVGQKIDFVRDITYFLSIAGRADEFRHGLISSKDVIYFIIVVVIFLGLTIIKLQSGRESKAWFVKAGRYILLLVSTLFIGYLSSRPTLSFYADTTATKQNTLTLNSQQVIRKIDKPVTITTYVNELDMYHYFWGMPDKRNEDLARFEQYQRFLPDIKFNYVYYYDKAPINTIYQRNKGLNDKQLAEKIALADNNDVSMFLPPAQIRKLIDLKDEKYSFVREIAYGDKKTFLRVYNDNAIFPTEQEITASLARLVSTPPVIGFMTGNGQRATDNARDESYLYLAKEKSFRYALINQGFDVVDIPAQGPIPLNISVLVLADPSTALDQHTTNIIKGYINKGGNMLITADTTKQNIINPLFNYLGVTVNSRVLKEQTKDFAPNLIFADLSKDAQRLDKVFSKIASDNLKVTMPGVTALSYTKTGNFDIKPFLTYRDTIDLALSLNRIIGDKQQRIILASDADFLSNAELGRFNSGNPNLYLGMFRWLSNSQFPVDITRSETPDNKLIISREEIAYLNIVLLYILPALILICGAILLIRRTRR